MRKIFLLIPLFLCLTSFSTTGLLYLGNLKSPKNGILTPVDNKLAFQHFSKIKLKEFEKLTGRTLSFKQKIEFKILQLTARKELKTKGGKASKGQTAFILGLIGLLLVLVPYGIIASLPLAIIAIVLGSTARKENPKDKKAKTAIILGWATLGVIILLLIIALIWLAAFSDWFSALGG